MDINIARERERERARRSRSVQLVKGFLCLCVCAFMSVHRPHNVAPPKQIELNDTER